jgi:uncharacterized protein (TIRG00374 family)
MRAGYAVPFHRLTAVTIFGFSLSSVTPGGTGDLIRVAVLEPYGVNKRDGASIVVYERLLDVSTMFAFLGASLLVTLASYQVLALSVAAGVLLLAVAAIFLIFARFFLGRLDQILPKITQRVLPDKQTAAVLLEPRTLFTSFLFTLGVFTFEALRTLLVLRSLGLEVDVFEAWVIFTLPFLAGLVSLLPLGVGSLETAAVWTFSLYGYDENVGAAGTVLLRSGITLPSLLAGILAMLFLRRGFTKYRAP